MAGIPCRLGVGRDASLEMSAAAVRGTSPSGTLLQDLGVRPTTAVVDLGYRGVDGEPALVQVIHRGKAKSLTAVQRGWLRRRQAVEPAIGHLKADHRMNQCWLEGSEGDALHAVLCAAGFNIRWLPRAIAAKGLLSALWLLGGALAAVISTVTVNSTSMRAHSACA